MTRLPARTSKYGSHKVQFAGIMFDSKVERDYYLLLLSRQQAGEIESFRIQPRYLLLASFEKHGKKFRPTEYIADFEIHYPDGRIEVVDVKGQETPLFLLKLKLFENNYPDLHLVRMRHVVKFGGWITTEEYNRLKRREKAQEAKLGTPRPRARRIAR